MGPVTAISYGIAIRDLKMARMAIVVEVASLMLCILIGVITAGFFLLTPAADDWPVPEMTSRGTMENFFAGIPIAFFSGLGVAVGLLDSQTNSLVGVAISASLLPPAVNCGMLLVIHLQEEYDSPTEVWRRYGVISLGLTVMNIGVIIVAALFMFRLKEVSFVLSWHRLASVQMPSLTIVQMLLVRRQILFDLNRFFPSKRVYFGQIWEWRGRFTQTSQLSRLFKKARQIRRSNHESCVSFQGAVRWRGFGHPLSSRLGT